MICMYHFGYVPVHFVLCFLFSLIKDDISYAQIAMSKKKNQIIIT